METWLHTVNKPSTVHTIAFAVIALLAESTGCSSHVRTYPVSGTVRFKTGGAVHVGTIELKSREHKSHARGQIQPDGSFTLTTYKDGDGAVAGMHDCVIVQFVMTEELTAHKASTVGVIDRRYASYSTSGLTAVIRPEKDNELIIEVDGLLPSQPTHHSH